MSGGGLVVVILSMPHRDTTLTVCVRWWTLTFTLLQTEELFGLKGGLRSSRLKHWATVVVIRRHQAAGTWHQAVGSGTGATRPSLATDLPSPLAASQSSEVATHH